MHAWPQTQVLTERLSSSCSIMVPVPVLTNILNPRLYKIARSVLHTIGTTLMYGSQVVNSRGGWSLAQARISF